MSMRRQGNHLPAIRNHEDYEYVSAPESRAVSRIDHLEDRLQYQERTTQALIDRAFKVKEDIINSLNINHGTWQEEKQARGLLQEHIRTITDVVKKLSSDIVVLEQQVLIKGGALNGTSNAVRSLEMQQVASLTDLRGRVARCDVALAKLAADMKTSSDSTQVLGKFHHDFSKQTSDHLKMVDAKIADMNSRIERSNVEQAMKLQNVEGGSHQGLTNLNNKTQSLVNDLRHNFTSIYAQEENQREKMEQRIIQIITNYTQEHTKKQELFEKKIDESLAEVRRRMLALEGDLQREKERSIQANQTLETKLLSAIDHQTQKQMNDFQRLRKECREGFSTIHESIDNMKQVTDGKRKLLEEQLRKEISQIRRMVVLV